MEGRLYYEPNKSLRPHGWIYTETQWDSGRFRYRMASDCWPNNNEGD
jgi:hypothetical protein